MYSKSKKISLQSKNGSILLMIVVISGFMLIAFSALSTKIRTELKNRLEIEQVSSRLEEELERVKITKDSFSGGRISTDDFTITSAKRGGTLSVYPGTPSKVHWTGTGDVQLSLITSGTQICYLEEPATMSTCTSTGITLSKSGGTGTLSITTSGGFAQLSPEGTSSGILLGIPVYFEITAPIGNISVPIAQLKTYY